MNFFSLDIFNFSSYFHPYERKHGIGAIEKKKWRTMTKQNHQVILVV